MSVQLVLYPQNYDGQYNAISNVATEKIVDGITFSSINTSSSANVPSAVPSAHITSAPPNIINTWFRSRSTVTGTPAFPDASGGDLYLYSVAAYTTSGVYQKLSNLIIGQIYHLTVTFDNTPSGDIFLGAYNGNNGSTINNLQGTITSFTTFVVFQFIAQTVRDIVQVNYTNTVADTFKITGISVVPLGTQPTFTNFHLEDGQVICDLYQEEDIPLTLSVDNFKNVAEKVQSYSKDFNLPATKRNNLIFDSIFEITRSDDGIIFNPYIKTQCVLKQDGYILFEGYLRLIDVQDQEGEISYNVNLYSEVVALADVLKDRTFSDLDFTELTHEYQKTNIKNSWNDSPSAGITYLNASTSGYRDANNTLKYPFVDWSHQILLSDGTNGTIDYPELTRLEQAFRPFINIKYLINRIFQDTPFTWTSTFFDSADFDKLFMDFNWGSNEFGTEVTEGSYSGAIGSLPVISSSATFQSVALASNTFDSAMGWDNANNRFVAVNDNTTYDLDAVMYMGNAGGTTTLTTRFARYDSGGSFIQEYDLQAANANNGIGSPPRFSQTEAIIDSGDYLQFEWKTTLAADGYLSASAFVSIFGTTGSLTATTNTILQTLRGETNQWDFLKGLMTMFNIVSLPDKDNPLNIIFAPYADVFISDTSSGTTSDLTLASRSIEHDWTDKVDVSEMKLTPLTDLNKQTIFKFVEDDDDYAFNIYKKSTQNHLYGSKKFDASAFTILEGTDEIIAEPFAATVPKPLFPQFSDFVTPAIFTANDEATEFEGFDNSPRIMYNNGVKTLNSGVTYYIPAQNGLDSEDQPQFLQFSHLTDIPTISSTSLVAGSLDFHFGECQYESNVGVTVPDNLYYLYWLPYYKELYNPDTRIMTMKVNLTPADINVFKMNDRVMIKNRSFRVNKIDYKPNNLATVEFILIP